MLKEISVLWSEKKVVLHQTWRAVTPWGWQLERLPRREEGFNLDLDSTVFERYGRQEGVRKG